MADAIQTHGLTRRFGRHDAVDGLTLAVPEGSVFALIGPNGAGKTTTIKLLMNLIRPTAGVARVLGTDATRLGPAELARIGYVSEGQELPEWLSPAEMLRYLRPFYPTWDDTLCRRLQVVLDLTARDPIRTLSRGTRMKASLLASLAYCPELVILDEPFSGLDSLVRDELIRALLELSGERPRTILVSSHDIAEVERLADWVGFIDRGRLILAERVDSLLARFRRVEVTTDVPSAMPITDRWLLEGAAGRMVRFIDLDHSSPDAAARIAAAFPGAAVHTSPLSLREIFVTLARRAAGKAMV
ncbi:MAG TPA: ABC transporter ATP-binding protein [Vicinamibacterales bacterium]|jgi:ABC-2 type transport system ATP-binding protein|nr:ABC transporter ATP-binding protein [Vicinamibacterales bacterium]